MAYANSTFNDRNAAKRWIHRRRLVIAAQLAREFYAGFGRVCDYGSGNGELTKVLRSFEPNLRVDCYDPTPSLLEEARANLRGLHDIGFCSSLSQLQGATYDVVFSLEVFEHLPPKETLDALDAISRLLKSGGIAIIGVPVEIGLAAAYRGVFRALRRLGAYDATPRNILMSVLGKPPGDRPCSEIAPGFHYYGPHMGFDYRVLKSVLAERAEILRQSTSPLRGLGPSLMPEVYFVIRPH